MKLGVPEIVLADIRQECERNYPEECCGVLLGSIGAENVREIVRVLHVPNQRDDERRTRYLIGPDAYQAADDVARRDGLDILGFYHSHPDHPAMPSRFDCDHAWPWYSYIIVPVDHGRAGTPRAWQLTEDRTHFDEVDIEKEIVVARTSEAS